MQLPIRPGFKPLVKASWTTNIIILSICVVSLDLLPMAMAEENPGDRAYATLLKADELVKKGEIETASATYLEGAALYEQALKAKPDERALKTNRLYCLDKSAFVLIKHADILRKEEDFAKAAPLYAKAVALYENVHRKLGSTRFANNVRYARVHGGDSRFQAGLLAHGPAPDFKLPAADAAGKSVKLSDLRGKTIALEFFATWCPSCVEAAPALARIQKELGDEKFVAVGVSLDKVEGFNRRSGGLEAFLKAAGTNHPVALGNDEVAQAYSVHSVPSIVLIDADGNLVKRVEDPANLLKEIKAVLMP